MAKARDSTDLQFYHPVNRGVFDLRTVRVPRRLRRWMRKGDFALKIDQDFDAVISACAEVTRPTQNNTWINDEIERVFCDLHAAGYSHCVSAYDRDGALVGGLYGLHLGGAFFGESMFSHAPNASKACLIGLFATLSDAGFGLVDAQMPNAHLDQFGLETWPNERFLAELPNWLSQDCLFPTALSWRQINQFLQSTTQTS